MSVSLVSIGILGSGVTGFSVGSGFSLISGFFGLFELILLSYYLEFSLEELLKYPKPPNKANVIAISRRNITNKIKNIGFLFSNLFVFFFFFNDLFILFT